MQKGLQNAKADKQLTRLTWARKEPSLIPKSLNFIWVGNPELQPDACIRTWIDQHPGWSVRVWGNDDLAKRIWATGRHVQTMIRERQWCGVADLMRWELLLEFGGVFLDADSVCLSSLPEEFLEGEAFACWENELDRPGLIATGYLGAGPGNPLIARIVQELVETPSVVGQEAWMATGPKRLSDAWRRYGYDRLTILPSHYFIPRHYSGRVYQGGGLVYADQFWGSTNRGYEQLAHSVDGWTPNRQAPVPRITVGMPARNASCWLREAVRSALDQDYPDFEVLVVDDESSDDTPAILASVQDPRLRVLRKVHTNLPDARNLILKEASGQYVCWLDSDDILLPNTLVAYSERARDWPKTAVFYGNLLKIDADGREIGRFNYDNHAGARHLLARLFIQNHMPMPGTLVSVSAMRGIDGFDEATAGSCDYDLWLRLAARGESFQHIGRDVVKYRWHGNNLSFNADHVRVSDLSILKKLVSTVPLEALCADLPWHEPERARKEALARVGTLFRTRGDAKQADLWLDWSSRGLPAEGEAETDIAGRTDPLPVLPITENPGSPFLATEADPGKPEPPPLRRELFLFEPDWTGVSWVKIVFAYISTFAPGDPVGLVLLVDQTKKGTPSAEEAQEMVVQAIAQTRRQHMIPDIIFLDHQEELLGVICGYDAAQWIRPTDQYHNLLGAAGNRLAATIAQLSASR